MRAVVQRVRSASVDVGAERVATIGAGLLVLLGVSPDDGTPQARWTARKIAALRVFPDAQGRMDASVADVGGAVLLVSQFTLYGDVTRGNRPSFTGAADGDIAAPLVEQVARAIAESGIPVSTGRFGAHMVVELVNDGPVTLWIEAPRP